MHHHRLCAIGEDELLAVERYLGGVHLIRVIHLVQGFEVLAAPPHKVGIFQVFQEIGRDTHHIILMRGTKVHVVIDNGTMTAGIVEQSHHLRPYHRIHGKERAKDNNIVLMDLGIHIFQLVVCMILVEDVFGLIVIIEKSQRDRRLTLWEHAHIVGIHPVFPQKIDNVFSHPVVTGLADKSDIHSTASQ